MDLSTRLPFSQACENNKQAILEVLKKELNASIHVLEVGSGTGQHSVYFAPRLPYIKWQTSDVVANHRTINTWHTAYPAPNLYAPLSFDLLTDLLPNSLVSNHSYDAVFTANTLHIISWALVKQLFLLVGNALAIGGKLLTYGPFNEAGHYTSKGNQQFDSALRQRDANSGIRDKEAVIDVASAHHLTLLTTYEMPANNRLLVFQKI